MATTRKQENSDAPAKVAIDLPKYANAIAVSSKLAQDLDRLRTAFKPIDVSFHSDIVRALEPSRKLQETIAQAVRHQHLFASQIQDIGTANSRLIELVRQTHLDTRSITNLSRVHATWSAQLSSVQDRMSPLSRIAELSIADSCRKLLVADRLLTQFDTSRIRAVLTANDEICSRLRDAAGRLTSGYRSLVESIPKLADVVALPDWWIPKSSSEVFATHYALRVAFVEDEQRDDDAEALADELQTDVSGSLQVLSRVDPALWGMYAGACAALERRTPDTARHVLTSLRELCNHLLRRLAPDDRVLAWVPQGDNDYLHQGRPTRKARVLYLCREIDHGPLRDFVLRDAQTVVELLTVFHRVHELDPQFSRKQLRALILRTESWISYVLRLHDVESA